MKLRAQWAWVLGAGVAISLLVGCQAQSPLAYPQEATRPAAPSDRIAIPVPMAWGGEMRCSASGCRLAVVEHETSQVAVHQVQGRASRLLARHEVAYHPDSAAWLTDDVFVAAVEASSSLDIFRVEGESLRRLQQIPVGFAPRDVVVMKVEQDRFQALATPYSGKGVTWVDGVIGGSADSAKVRKARWCEAPWHPVAVSKAPGAPQGGVAVACLDDRKVVFVPKDDVLAQPRTLATFPAIARQTRPSPSGQWLYVALETGGRNARVDMETGELQWVKSPLTGAVGVAPLADDLVIWSEDSGLYLQRLDARGDVLETRWLRTSGFSTGLQLLDIDGDGERDVLVLNSSDQVVDVIYGPLWERATLQRP